MYFCICAFSFACLTPQNTCTEYISKILHVYRFSGPWRFRADISHEGGANSYCIMCPFSSIHGTVGPDPSYFHSISNETCVVSGEQLFSLFCLINFCAMSLIILIHNTLKSFETYLQKFSFLICALTS